MKIETKIGPEVGHDLDSPICSKNANKSHIRKRNKRASIRNKRASIRKKKRHRDKIRIKNNQYREYIQSLDPETQEGSVTLDSHTVSTHNKYKIFEKYIGNIRMMYRLEKIIFTKHRKYMLHVHLHDYLGKWEIKKDFIHSIQQNYDLLYTSEALDDSVETSDLEEKADINVRKFSDSSTHGFTGSTGFTGFTGFTWNLFNIWGSNE